jgi:membrane protease YdiL (CAAX protease family)
MTAPVAALVASLAVMVGVNVWVHVGPERLQPVTGPLAAALMIVIGRAAGLSWEQLGLGPGALARGLVWGAVAVAVVAAGYAVALLLPLTQGLFRDPRYRGGPGAVLYLALLAVPLGTVVFEEVAFRGVVWGVLAVTYGSGWAIGISSLLFGLWHVLPALDGSTANAATPGRRTVALRVVGTVLFTAVAGVVFAWLRLESGSLVTPVLLHWATNGLGVVAVAITWALRPD